jgi:hypothetical protein
MMTLRPMRILTVIDSLNLAGAEALIKDTVPRMVEPRCCDRCANGAAGESL